MRELGRAQPAVIADRRAFAAGIGKGRREGTPEAVRIGREQGFADNAADVVLAQDRRIETMRHGGIRSQIALQYAAQRRAELGVLQTKCDIGFEIAELFAAIIPTGARAQPMKRLTVGNQLVEAIG